MRPETRSIDRLLMITERMKKMKLRKTLALLSAVLLSAGMLSACSDGKPLPNPKDLSSAPTQSSDEKTENDHTGDSGNSGTAGNIVYDDDRTADTDRGTLIRKLPAQGYTRAAGGRGAAASEWNSLKTQQQKKLTLMVYMVGSNLESEGGAASDDLIEMLDAGIGNPDVNLIVYCGGANSWFVNLQANTNNYLVYRPDEQNFEVFADTKKNMGEAETFSAFMNEVTEKFPAEHYGMICWNHGSGPLGFGNDETYPDPEGLLPSDSLSLTEMKAALQSTPFRQQKLDFIGFDACLMSSLEVTEVWKDYADLMIASTDLEPGCGWDYTFLEALNSTLDPQAFAESAINHYADFIRAQRSVRFDPDYSLFSIDLSKADELLSRSEDLFAAMEKAFSKGNARQIITSRKRAHVYGGSRDSASSMDWDITDFGEFAKELSKSLPDETKALGRTIQSMITYGRTNIKGCRGITVYFPDNESVLYDLWGRDFIRQNDYAPNYVRFMNRFSERWGGTASRAFDSFTQEKPEQPSQGSDPDSIYTSYQLTEQQLEDFSDAYYTVLRKIPKESQVGVDREEATHFLTVVEQIPLYPDENGVLKLNLNPDVILVDTGSHEATRDMLPVPFDYIGVNGDNTQYQSTVTAVGTDMHHFPFHQNVKFVKVDLKARKDSNAAQIMEISVQPSVNSDGVTEGGTGLVLSGKSTLSGEDQHLFYFHVHPSEIKDSEIADSTTPYTEMIDTDSSYFSMCEFEDGFGFMQAKLSDVYIPDTYYYQIIINDRAGKPHAQPISEISMKTEYDGISAATDKGELQFAVFDDHAELTSYAGEDTEIVIPDKADGKPVTVINDHAFASSKTLTSVTVPDSVASIRYSAFSGCSALTSVSLPESLKEIGSDAFSYTALEELKLPESLEEIGNYTFSNADLTALRIGKNVRTIGVGAFANMKKMKTLTVDAQNSVYTVKDNVLFSKDGKTLIACVGMFRESYTVPEGVEVIAASAFEGCGSVPMNDLYEIDEKDWSYPDEDGFWHFAGLKEIKFPKSLKRIEASAFYSCIGIQKLEFPENLEYIGPAAFASTMNYVSRPEMEIRIPAKLTHIAYHAFAGYQDVSFTVDPKNPVYAAKNGKLTNLSGDSEICVQYSGDEGILVKKKDET